VLQHDAEARVLGIRAARPGTWPERITVGNRPFRLAWCESPLSAREALLDGDTHTEGLILLTDADDQALGADVLARLARGRVFRLQSWELVRDLFQARDIDPRLGKLAWMADLLVEGAPATGYAPAPGGFLSADTAWQQVLTASLGIPVPRPDVLALVEWTLSEDASARLQALTEPMRTDVAGWVAAAAGAAGRPVVACVAAGKGADVLPLGLLCELLFREGGQADPGLSAAAARLERFTDGQRVEPLGGRRWGEAAAAALARLADPARVRTLLARADTLLSELGLTAQAEASDVLQAGFDARLARYAEALAAAGAAPSAPRLVQAEAAAARVLAHGQARHHPGRCARIRMSLRLLRWLASPDRMPGDFLAAAKSYAEEGAFVDWARMTLLGGDDLGPLSGAYAGLALAVRARRERLNRRFAELLLTWNGARNTAGSTGAGVGLGLMPVEDILGAVLAPLAAQCPTLLLVADGMSLAVFRALFGKSDGTGVERGDLGQGPPALVGVATLPTLTESSRTSLLCGRLTLGSASQEKSGFSTHPALLAVSRPTARPVLFHKSELGDGSGLSDAVREALRARDQRVVGVVYNAVDDHLSGSDQLHQTWSVDDLRLLGPLLHEARLAGRAVVVTADHGHVLDEGTTLRSHEDGDRWRRGAEAPAADEILIGGDRVLAPGGWRASSCPGAKGCDTPARRTAITAGPHRRRCWCRWSCWCRRRKRCPAGHWARRSCRSGGMRRRRQVRRPVPRCAPSLRRSRRENGGRRPARRATCSCHWQPHRPTIIGSNSSWPPRSMPSRSGSRHASPPPTRTCGAFCSPWTAAAESSARPRWPSDSACRWCGSVASSARCDGCSMSIGRRWSPSTRRPGGRAQPRAAGSSVPDQGPLVDAGSPPVVDEVIGALRRGTVPESGLDLLAVGLEGFEPTLTEELEAIRTGRGLFKAVRGEYGCGKTFFGRWLQEHARTRGFATSEIQASETETPLHRMETVYRRVCERLTTSEGDGAFRSVIDGWFYTLEQDVLADGRIDPGMPGAGRGDRSPDGAAVGRCHAGGARLLRRPAGLPPGTAAR
jgi:hypothetical protein